LIPGHLVSFRSTDTVRAEFERQASQDWEAFLSVRAKELRHRGRLVVVLPALADDGTSGFETIMDQANSALAQMVADGAIMAEERVRMVLGSHPRRKCDLLAPFEGCENFQCLIVEDLVVSELPDAAWIEYEQNGDKELLATKHARFFHSVFMPTLASALDRVRSGDAEALRVFGDRLEAELRRRLTSQPAAMHSLVQTIVLSKQIEE
jgi:hypothetical protein